ncbi:hypothetical protein [Marinicella meishanensis]|uniref:hypothetical protein n=1 Tax=Marinicella meishanensis TaxID=2873263 RepID=UPI001CBC4A53|nr:hypothetical protein [Marinicella sp. NBU2979]
MAINKKNSRKIAVEGHDFRWRASGNDGWITVVVWPITNEDSRAVASVGYHHDFYRVSEGHYSSRSQLVVTNRMIRALILHTGVEVLLNNHGQIDVGHIEEFYDVENAVRGGINAK